MVEVDVFISNYTLVDPEIYELWIKGYTGNKISIPPPKNITLQLSDSNRSSFIFIQKHQGSNDRRVERVDC